MTLDTPSPDEILALLPAQQGHFRFESGHHGTRWLDVERLYLHPPRIQRLAGLLAGRIAKHEVQVVCGPLVEGAFVALTVASELGVPFTYAERFDDRTSDALFPVQYRLPRALRGEVAGKRVGIVNDIINAGSAVRGAFHDLRACGAHPVALGALLVLGPSAAGFAAEHRLALEALASLPNDLWTPDECPLCARGIPVVDLLAP